MGFGSVFRVWLRTLYPLLLLLLLRGWGRVRKLLEREKGVCTLTLSWTP